MIFLYLLGTMLMIAMPLLLASRLAGGGRADWGLFGLGAATFVAAQVLHIPFNLLVERLGLLPADLAPVANLLAVVLFLGLSAGVFEEVARYLAYRFWARNARRWRQGLMLGAGHGGLEAIMLGLLALVNLLALFGMEEGYFTALVPAEQLPLVLAQARALQEAAWYDALLAPAERAFALAAHLALSLLVLQTFLRRQARWLLLAIGWHALLDAVAVFAVTRWNVYAAEAAVGLIALLSVGLIFALRRPRPDAPVQDVGTATESPAEGERDPARTRPAGALTAEKLEQRRYH